MKFQLSAIVLIGYVMTCQAASEVRKSRSVLLDSVIKTSEVKVATPSQDKTQKSASKIDVTPSVLT